VNEQPTEKKFTLHRIASGPNGTYGVLIDGEMPFALTLEPPWKNNEKFVSCIPASVYACESVNSPRFGYTFGVNGVPDRSHIVFHCGNFHSDTKGCILVGEQFDDHSIVASKAGYREFMFRLKDCESFTLEIKG